MLGPPADVPSLWIGLALFGVVAVGLAVDLPPVHGPDATRVAETVDRVAASRYPASTARSLAAEKVRIGPRRIALAADGVTAHAPFRFGPVVPVREDSRLERVLEGDAPPAVFEDPTVFSEAVAAARDRSVRWQPAGEELLVRHVRWEGVDVTLVGA
ncbi:MAG: hypothetical protein ABEJ08_04795 [Halobacteriaceae archaeon]